MTVCKYEMFGGPGLHSMFRHKCIRKALPSGYCWQHDPERRKAKRESRRMSPREPSAQSKATPP